MLIKCASCQFECDTTDAFCRKCGMVLAQEAQFVELPAEAATAIQAEASAVEIVTPPVTGLAKRPSSRVASLSRKVGSKVADALKSEQGKKLTRGAATLAVAVGVELVTHATQRLSKAPANRADNKLARPPVGVGDTMLKALEDHLATDRSDVVEESYYRERVYVRRVIRRRP